MSSLAQPCPCKHGRGFAPFVNKTAICCLFSQTFSSSSLTSTDDEYLVLKEYPVRKIISVFALFHFGQPAIIETDFYKIAPDEKDREDIPYTIILSPAILRLRSLASYRVIYRAGYDPGDVPADLAAACLELAAWNMFVTGKKYNQPLKSGGGDGWQVVITLRITVEGTEYVG